ncbi:MAG TPA: HEAT repeat domain-containing protein, partial [Myxococcaceae bacterium]|nr:HEAT repeat domain-containing protein [Myxococcaceae bacterium]
VDAAGRTVSGAVAALTERAREVKTLGLRFQTLHIAARAHLTAHPRRGTLMGLFGALLLGGLGVWGLHRTRPEGRAEAALSAGDPEGALRLLQGTRETPSTWVLKGRALYGLKRREEGLSQFKAAARITPSALASDAVLHELALELGGPRSVEAGELLTAVGEPAVSPLSQAAADEANAKRRWAAVEVLRKLHREDAVDLASVYLADLRARDCNTRVRAAKELGELGDRRAVEPLREMSQRRTLFLDACDAPAARAALKKIEKRPAPDEQ